MDKPKVSFTRIQSFNRYCRLPYWYRYIENRTETNEPEAFRNGRLWQETVYDRLRTGKAKDDDPNGIKDLISYLNSGWWVSGLEEHIEFDVGEAIVHGYLDILLENELGMIVLDIKGAWYPDLTDDRLYQLLTYSIPFYKPDRSLEVGVLARSGIQVKEVTVQELDEHLECLREDIRKMLDWEETEKRKGKVPRPAPSDACAYCTYVKACPVGENLDISDIHNLAKWYVKTEQELKLARKVLQGYIRANGPIELGNPKALALKESQRTQIDEEALWKILEGKLDFITEHQWPILRELIAKAFSPDKRKILRLAKYEGEEWANAVNIEVVHDRLGVVDIEGG